MDRSERAFRIRMVLFLEAAIADIAVTTAFLSTGIEERNRIAGALLESHGLEAVFLYKSLATLVAVGGLYLFHHAAPSYEALGKISNQFETGTLLIINSAQVGTVLLGTLAFLLTR